jgi:UDP-GlcNAc:undecaprenyl-phosphate GlcNAc-1-phosphate transferase
LYLTLVFFGSFVLSLAAISFVLKLSYKNAWYDKFDERKIHTGEIPRLGGIGFAPVFILFALGIILITGNSGLIVRFIPCIIALLITLVYGVWDDFRSLPPKFKLFLQVLAALLVLIPGYSFNRIVYMEAGLLSNLGFIGLPVTFFWVVGLPNAINFIDGVDGLAGGLSAIITFFFALIFLRWGDQLSVLLCASLLAVLLGFLVFNAPAPKAKIFMGDGGSQFLGLIIALLPLLANGNSKAALPVPYAAALLAIPVFDTFAAIWRRLRDGKRFDSPDKGHIHHKLINLGLNSRGVVLVLYSLQIILGITVYFSIRLEGLNSLLVLGAAYLIVSVFFITLHFLNRRKAYLRTSGEQPL